MRKLAFAAALFVFSVAFPVLAQNRTGEGWNSEGQKPEEIVESKNAADQFAAAEQYEKDGDTKKAIASYRRLLKKWPNAQSAPRAQLQLAQAQEKIGDYDAAFKSYGQYLSKYPHGEQFDRAVESQFRIARLFLEGQKHKLLGVVPVAASASRAQAMFEEIVKNAAYSKFAPQAQFNVGRALEKQGKDREAIVAYQAVISRYPNDPAAADAQYQIAYLRLQEAKSSGDHATATKAREAFEDYLAKYPDSEKSAQARDNMKALTNRETHGSLDVAKFYDKKKNYKAAYIYYNDVIKQQPNSDEAAFAKKRIEELRGLVGEDALRSGPERTETGKRAEVRRKLQAKVETAARPDYAGPPVVIPDEIPSDRGAKMRSSPASIGPVPNVEPPPLPAKDATPEPIPDSTQPAKP